MLLDQRPDPVLPEADVAPLVGDGARERVGELGVGLAAARLEQLEHGERHPFEHDVLTDDTGHEIARVDLLQQHLGELHQVGVGEMVDGGLEVLALDTQIMEPLGEDLDVAGLVERLRGQEALAGEVRGGVDQPGRSGQGATLADDELHRRADGVLAEILVVEQELGFLLVGLVAVNGVLEIPLRAQLQPPLDRIRLQEVTHSGTPPCVPAQRTGRTSRSVRERTYTCRVTPVLVGASPLSLPQAPQSPCSFAFRARARSSARRGLPSK